MIRRATGTFPHLRQVFTGYLHEDFAVEHGSPEAAMRAFRKDASTADLRGFRREVKRFLAHITTLEFEKVRELLEQLGARWSPPSQEALVKLLTDAASRSGPAAP